MKPNKPLSNISKLSLAIAAASLSTTAFSAGLDRTGQDIRGFFNEGTYAEVDFVYIDTDVSAVDHGVEADNGMVPKYEKFVKGNDTGNITGDSTFLTRYGVKADLNDNVVIGIFHDKPWGANVRFENEGNFVSNVNQKINLEQEGDDPVTPEYDPTILTPSATAVNKNIKTAGYDNHTRTRIESESTTALIGFKKNGFQIYGGPVAQKFEMETHLRGNATGPLSGYDLNVAKDTAYGWAAGVSYSIPEIMLNVALTYRSPITHETNFAETVPIMGNMAFGSIITGKANKNVKPGEEPVIPSDVKPSQTTRGSITTPESVNLNFQTGLSKEHQLLGTLNARWVPWSKFKVVPPYYNAVTKANYPDGLPILQYGKDQYSVDIGLAKRFTDNLAGSAIVGYDSGAGEMTSSLGPVNGAWSVGGGIKYNLTEQFAVTAGGKYMFLGDATGVLPTGNVVNKASDNHGYAAVLKLSYHEK